ncbi:hypothetical protein FRC08_005694 [Ceratobasidium sp. 394]|nr:hypothetical protein FRC08_005694 [Ceratobasidium sp. 394]
MDQERWILVDFCEKMADWQGLTLPLPWHAIDMDFRQSLWRYVSPSRVPPGLDRFDHPVNWPDSAVALMMHWIRLGQQWLANDDHDELQRIFQWREPDVPDMTRFYAHENALLQYGEDSASYYVATMKYEFPADAYTLLPATPRLFGSDVFKDIENFVPRAQRSLTIANLIELYERFNPPQPPMSRDDPQIMRRARITTVPLLSVGTTPAMPSAFYDWNHDDHEKWQLRTFVLWASNPANSTDSTTGLLYGGPRGVAQIFVATLLVHNTYHWLRYTFGPCPRTWISNYKDYNRQISFLEQYMLNALNRSLDVTCPTLPDGSRVTSWNSLRVAWSNSAGGCGTDPPSDTRSDDLRQWVAWASEIHQPATNDVIELSDSDN